MRTFLWKMMIVFLALYLAPIMIILGYIWFITTGNIPIRLIDLLFVSAFMFMLSIFSFFWFSLKFRTGIAEMINNIHAMLAGNRVLLSSEIPVTTQDELGQLKLAFNQIQYNFNCRNFELDQELNYAYEVQRELLPLEFHQSGDLQVAANCRQSHEVGGDLYDVIELADKRVAVIVGDVSGKGMPAALLMSSMISLFRREIRGDASAADVLNTLNRTICEIVKGEMFITLGLAIIDQSRQSIQYASAGHMSPFLIKKNGTIKEIDVSSLPLGIDENRAYKNIQIEFPAAHLFVMYTDGVIEIEVDYFNGQGFTRFEEHLKELLDDLDIQIWLRSYMERLEQMTTGMDHTDDRTLLIVAHLTQ